MARGDPISNVKRNLVGEAATIPAREKPVTDLPTERSVERLGWSPPLTHRISIRIDTALHQAICEAVQSAQLGERFHYANVSDFIREALTDYKEGMKLTVPSQRGQQTKITSVCFTAPLLDFWRSLPRTQHFKILDRVLRTKLEQM